MIMWNTGLILVLFINYHIIFHMNNRTPIFAPSSVCPLGKIQKPFTAAFPLPSPMLHYGII